MRTERGFASWNSGHRASAASIAAFAAASLLAACSFSGGSQADLVADDVSQTSGPVDSSVLDDGRNAKDGGASSSQFVVKVASGYLRKLMDSTFGMENVDYGPLLGAHDTLNSSEIVVAGYLFEIKAGVTVVDTTVRMPLTDAEQRVALAELDERERFFIAEGWTGPEWQELEEARRSVIENKPLRAYNFDYAAYRIRVTEVIKGDMKVGDILDVQVYAGVEIASEWVDPVLVGTPRVVVAGGWGTYASPFELRNSTGQPVEEAFWPHIDLFWLDEGVWDGHKDASVVGAVGVVQEILVERPAPTPEAHHLTSLQGLHDAWGNLETLDDLAEALRTAATELSAPSTTASTLE